MTCTVDGCHRDHHARGYCSAHHRQWLRTGTHPTALVRAPRPTFGDGECLTCVDACHLLRMGESIDVIAARLDFVRPALLAHLRKHNHRDLLERHALLD